MWWLEARRLSIRASVLFVASLALAGCFQPLYADHSLTDKPGIGLAMAAVDVTQIAVPNGSPEARVAVELRNQLLFNIAGGHEAPPPLYRLNIKMHSDRLSVIVDINSGRPDVEEYGLHVDYTLVDIKTGKALFDAYNYARVSYDIPGQAQRFARARGLRDSETRAAKEIADSIRARMASYLVAGT